MKTSAKLLKLAFWIPIFTIAVFASACDSDEQDEESAELVASSSDLYSAVTSDLPLTVVQQNRVNNILRRFEGVERQPGFLWIIADSLAQTLTDAQIERLTTPPDTEKEGGFFGHRGLFMGQGNGSGFWGNGDGFAGGQRGEGHGAGFGRFIDELDLTDEQETALRELREDFRGDVEALIQAKKNGRITEEEFRSQMEDLRAEHKAAVDEILTDEQEAALLAAREEHQERRRENREENREEARAVRDEVLGLTAEESTAYDAIVDELFEALSALREQARGGDLTREALRDEAKSLWKNAADQLEAMLTEDQFVVVKIHAALVTRVGHRMRHAFREGAGG